MRGKLILGLLITFLFAQNAFGQENSGSTIKVQFTNGYWLVDFLSDNVSAMESLKKENAKFDSSEMGIEGVEKAYRSYLKESFSLEIDTSAINLKFVSAEINSALANAQFISARFKEIGMRVFIKSTAYSKLPDHPVKLVVMVGDEKYVSWLLEENGFQYQLDLSAED